MENEIIAQEEQKAKRPKDALPSDERISLDAVKDVESCIEAILFAAGYPVKYSKIAEALGMDTRHVKKLIGHMEEYYNSPDNRRGLVLLLFPDTCQLTTDAKFLPYIRDALGIKRGGNLSASSLEVLSIIAYNQPITRATIDKIRGLDSAYAVSTLTDKELITQCGRLDAPGRPVLYATTDKFLRIFGLSSIEDLPEVDVMQAALASMTDEGNQLAIDVDAPAEETVI